MGLHFGTQMRGSAHLRRSRAPATPATPVRGHSPSRPPRNAISAGHELSLHTTARSQYSGARRRFGTGSGADDAPSSARGSGSTPHGRESDAMAGRGDSPVASTSS